MKWRKITPYASLSDAHYTVARYIVNGRPVYRASTEGRFIGPPMNSPQEATQACEAHCAAVVAKQPG